MILANTAIQLDTPFQPADDSGSGVRSVNDRAVVESLRTSVGIARMWGPSDARGWDQRSDALFSLESAWPRARSILCWGGAPPSALALREGSPAILLLLVKDSKASEKLRLAGRGSAEPRQILQTLYRIVRIPD